MDTTEPAGREPPLTAFQLLGRRDFAIYWWSQFISNPGNWLHNVTASVVMLTITGSPFMVGLLNVAIFSPTLLVSLPAGALGDRVDRRWLVAISNTFGALAAAVLTVLSVLGLVTAVSLLVLCSLIGAANSFAKPALNAILPSIVPRGSIGRAIALNVIQFQAGQIVGPGLASVLLLTASPAWAFGLNAASFMAPVIAMMFIRLGGSVVRPTGNGRGSIVEGLRFILNSPLMPAILAGVVLANGAVEAMRTLAPTIAATMDTPEAAGVIIMGYSIGGVTGLLLYGTAERLLPRRWTLVIAFGLQALGLLLLGLAPTVTLSMVASVPIGLAFALTTPRLNAALQELSPDEYRGRVMAAFSMAHLGLRPAFALLAGALATVSIPLAIGTFVVIAMYAAGFVRWKHVGDS